MVPTSTRAHEHTSTRAHEHTSTRAHDNQPIPPQKNLTIRGNTSPATAQKYVTNTHQDAPPSRAAPQKTPRHEPARPNRRPLHPKNPMSPPFHRGQLHFEQALGGFATIDPSTGTRHWPFQATTGGFATIDPRHADDTPQGSAYGSNSPQATNEHKPQHHDKQTKTSRTRPTLPPKGHTTLALPSNHGGFATIDHRHADDTPQRSAYGSNSPHRAQASTKAPPSQPSTRRNVGTESRRKPQPYQSQHQASTRAHPSHPNTPRAHPSQHQSTPKSAQKPHTKSAQHAQHIHHAQHTRRGAAVSVAAPLPGSQPETRVT